MDMVVFYLLGDGYIGVLFIIIAKKLVFYVLLYMPIITQNKP